MIIAHRLSTIKSADVIIGLEAGKVVEEGSHSQLIAQEGLYSGLVKTQNSFSREMSLDSLGLLYYIQDSSFMGKGFRPTEPTTVKTCGSHIDIYSCLELGANLRKYQKLEETYM